MTTSLSMTTTLSMTTSLSMTTFLAWPRRDSSAFPETSCDAILSVDCRTEADVRSLVHPRRLLDLETLTNHASR